MSSHVVFRFQQKLFTSKINYNNANAVIDTVTEVRFAHTINGVTFWTRKGSHVATTAVGIVVTLFEKCLRLS